MGKSYNPVCGHVNNSSCLTEARGAGSFFFMMKYGERLKKAREYAGLSQAALVLKMKGAVTQQNVSKLEIGESTGSEFTVQFAEACGVNPYWLATGEGEMIDGVFVDEPELVDAINKLRQMSPAVRSRATEAIESAIHLFEDIAAGK